MSVFRIEWLSAHRPRNATWRLPKPLRPRRPGETEPEKKTVSMRDFARQMMKAPARRQRGVRQ